MTICDARPYIHIDGANQDYVLFANGKIYSRVNQRFLKTTIDFNAKSGYPRENVELKCSGARRHCAVSRLLALHFIPNPKGLELVDHINRNSLDNRLENLRWISRSGNRNNSGAQKNNKLKLKHIHFNKSKELYVVKVSRDKTNFSTSTKTLEQAILIRNSILDLLEEPYENID